MSALPAKPDMCGATRDEGQKRTYERHLPAAGGQAVRDIKPTHCSIRRCPSWRRQPGRAAGTPGELMAEHAPSRVTPAARLCAGRLRIWRNLPDDGKVSPSNWKRGIQDRIDEGARQSSALSRSGRRAHCLLRRCVRLAARAQGTITTLRDEEVVHVTALFPDSRSPLPNSQDAQASQLAA